VSRLSSELNTVYCVIGPKSDLIRQGILVEEGHKRFVVVGGRTLSAARDLDPSKFTKIDRLRDRMISFSAGEYTIFTRQSLSYASPITSANGKLAGCASISWSASGKLFKFLIIIKSRSKS
jgi:hypothetical protein